MKCDKKIIDITLISMLNNLPKGINWKNITLTLILFFIDIFKGKNMKSLGRLLRNSIESSGYTIYRAASKSGINRTTLQKVLSGDRPASQELLTLLLPILKLSPSEEKNILDMYEISQSGEALYLQRRYIKKMLNSISDLNLLPNDLGNDFNRLTSYETNLFKLNDQIIYGIYNVEHLLGILLNNEYTYDIPKIFINVPGNVEIIEQFFMHKLSYCNNSKDLKIKHITSLVKTPETSSNPLINLDILSKIFPFAILGNVDYEIFYYYSNELNSDTLNMAFPYYILFSETVVLLNADGTIALPIHDPAVNQYFQNLFSESLKHSFSLVSDCTTPLGILNYLKDADKDTHSRNEIGFQPCFYSFLTDNMIQKYTRFNIENRDQLIQSVTNQIQQLSNVKKHINIFSQSGLTHFIQTGILTNFPTSYAFPIEKADRILLLKCLYDACKSEKITVRMANPVTFLFSRHLICNLRNNWGLDFSGFDDTGMRFRYIHIQEHTIREAFEDFFHYLLDSDLVYSKQETLTEITHAIGELNC